MRRAARAAFNRMQLRANESIDEWADKLSADLSLHRD
jgi:hypothetical protein